MIYNQTKTDECMPHAISCLREILGYKGNIVDIVDPDKLKDVFYFFECIKYLFPDNKCTLFINNTVNDFIRINYPHLLEDINLLDKNIDYSNFYGDYVYMWDYWTAGSESSHCVVGFPIKLPGTDIQFILRVSLNE